MGVAAVETNMASVLVYTTVGFEMMQMVEMILLSQQILMEVEREDEEGVRSRRSECR